MANKQKNQKHYCSSSSTQDKSEITNNSSENSDQSDSGKKSKFHHAKKNDSESRSRDALNFAPHFQRQEEKLNTVPEQMNSLSNIQDNCTLNSEWYNNQTIANKNVPNAYYEIQNKNYLNNENADPNVWNYNEYDYNNNHYSDASYQYQPQESYYQDFNENINYNQHPSNYCSNYDYNEDCHNYGQPQMYSNYHTESGYGTNNYDSNVIDWNAQNNEFQHSQPQMYQNYQANNFNQQDTMAYNFNNYNLTESYRQNAYLKSETFDCYESNDQMYLEDIKQFPYDYTYGQGRI